MGCLVLASALASVLSGAGVGADVVVLSVLSVLSVLASVPSVLSVLASVALSSTLRRQSTLR